MSRNKKSNFEFEMDGWVERGTGSKPTRAVFIAEFDSPSPSGPEIEEIENTISYYGSVLDVIYFDKK